MKVICIILARAGSKGIKNKNIARVNSKPLVFYPINAAIKSKVCDKIIVSTDSKKIAKVAKRYGALVPFYRSKKLSGDFITTEKSLQDCLLKSEIYFKTKFDICLFLTCTNIFRKISWIKYAIKILKKNKKIDSIFCVHQIYKHFWHYKNGKYRKVLQWMNSYTSRQIAPKFFREDTGIVCATRANYWRIGKRIGKNIRFIINDDPFSSIDIHKMQDLKLAEMAVRYLKKNKLDYDMAL